MAILVRPKHLLCLLYQNQKSAAVGLLPLPLSRHFCDASSLRPNSSPSSDARSRTPLEKQFDSWVDRLRPGFTSNDVAKAIRAQSDSDLALDLFRNNSSNAPACRPSIETYSMLPVAVLRQIGKPPVSYVYLHSIRSLARQMKSSGMIPDTFALNLIIKAYVLCLEMEEAI
ncbi:hypothetical protein ZIOFF_067645 [Zingiber officinale]|uniref:Pentatricopeptide repeat-containing protein n=1 Tax=Zingiber officinale TaxID=94328 RepID=A0A8J5BKB8_ZINOF|nr:hypothetical protein ZIOFF_067645 [Zingiber officinale]